MPSVASGSKQVKVHGWSGEENGQTNPLSSEAGCSSGLPAIGSEVAYRGKAGTAVVPGLVPFLPLSGWKSGGSAPTSSDAVRLRW